MFNTSCQISQNAILLQETRAGHSWQSRIHDPLTPCFPPTPPLHTGPRGLAQLRTLLHAKRTRPRARNTTHTAARWERARTSVADNSHPVIFDCGPLMLGQRHLTHSSVGLGPPGATLPPATGCQRVTSALQNKHRNLSARDDGGEKRLNIVVPRDSA